jgi:type I restriction-modification system DNA methylase subunit
VLKGSFDKYAESSKLKKGTATVDNAFLAEIEDWRNMLARNIALRNASLTQRELNFAVQRTMDRIVFLRICEDRGIEEYGKLQMHLNGTNIYKRLVQLFSQADDRYNSGLFHFQREKDRLEEPDILTLSISIDDKPLKEIIKRLYYPESPYEFSVLPADILGQVYEQFLGKVIRLTPTHQARVEEKPEVRKAGGVYYTPQFIVDYIVKNTVGKLIEERKPKEVEKLKILDPACGSGSFLLGAYQYLLDWHLTWYNANEPEKWAKTRQPAIYQRPSLDTRTPNWHLTTAEKKRILLNNIFGVDIDSQAVEVTKLSLLLKVLEGENSQTLATELRLFHQRALPDLGSNIKCGNSLIGSDFYHKQTLLDDEERLRINVFDWEKEFPTIMKAGGFDSVIGNPPYVRIQTLLREQVDYFNHTYQSATGNYDIYALFTEKSLSLLKETGLHGFIVPHKFFQASYGEGLRRLIAESNTLSEIINFRDNQIFKGASTYTCLLFLAKINAQKFKYAEIRKLMNPEEQLNNIFSNESFSNETMQSEYISKMQASSTPWNFHFERFSNLIEKIRQDTKPLEELTDRIFQGLKTSADKIYIMDVVKQGTNSVTIHSKELNKEFELEGGPLKPLIKGGQMKRYYVEETKKVVLFPYENGKLITKKDFQEKYPLCWGYLNENKKYLEDREDGKMKGENWYAYVYPKSLDKFALKKIVTPDIAPSASYSFDEEGTYYFSGGAAGGYGVLARDDMNPKYLLALLNSKMIDWYHHQFSTTFRGGYFSYEARFIKQLPIHMKDLGNSMGKARHDKIVSLADQMLSLNKRLSTVKTDHEKTALKRQIETIDGQIDQLVYGLYKLTEEEIRIIEGRHE